MPGKPRTGVRPKRNFHQRRCLRVLVLMDAEMCYAFGYRGRTYNDGRHTEGGLHFVANVVILFWWNLLYQLSFPGRGLDFLLNLVIYFLVELFPSWFGLLKDCFSWWNLQYSFLKED